MQNNRRLRRRIARMLALCLLCAGALAEVADLGDVQDWTQGQAQDWTDDAAQDWSEGYVQTDGDQAQLGLNTDADLRLGYVATGEINPFVCTDRDLVSLNQLVFESVVEFDDQMKPTPLLADSWTVQDKAWTFKLREGVVFHNGAALTAWEVLDSFHRFQMVDSTNPYYSRVQMIESMEVLDEMTLVVNSRYSGYVTLYAMTFPIVESGTLDDGMARGTGPYWYTEYIAGLGVRLEANPLWWKKDPEIHSVAALNYYSSGDALEGLRLRQINTLCTQSNHAAVNRKLSDITSMDYVTNNYEMLVPNLSENSLMSDIRMRQAVMYGVDRSNIAEYGYAGMGVQCEVPVNPSSWLYESQSAIYYYSPERALQLIQSCGWQDLTGDGMLNQVDGVVLKDLTLRLITYNEGTNTVRQNAADLIANQLAKVGVHVEVSVYSKEKCLQRVKERDYDLALVGVQLSEIPNLAPMLQSGGSLNLNNFKNDSMETLLGQVSSATSEEQLKSIYSQMQMIVVERLPVLGLLFRTGAVLSTRSLSGLSGLRVGDMLNGIEFMSKQG